MNHPPAPPRTTGLVLGKFLPPTRGHQYLVDFARSYVDDLTVVVGTLAREPIPGDLRVTWMRELFPGVRVLHLSDENPQFPEEHQDFWQIWHDSLRRLVPTGPDFVFASEPYGAKLAEVLGATFIPVDVGRELVSISATAVRTDPMGCWDWIPPAVRPWFVRRVRVIGPESTGKTTLCRHLARVFDTVWVHEYARGLIDARGGAITADLFPVIVRGQRAAEAALARQARRVLICDTDRLTTALYHELFFGSCPDWLAAEVARDRWDLTLVCEPDTPFVADSQRFFPERRRWFLDRCLAAVAGTPHVRVRGGWRDREATAEAAVQALLTSPGVRLPG